jgi:predicted nucleic acid-binding protein
MILYADTSALLKRYIQETGSEQVTAQFDRFPVIGTTALTLAEAAFAMSKAVRLRWVNEDEIMKAWQDFLTHWPAYARLPVSTRILERAASLTWAHSLRANDAIHLASALAWRDMAGDELLFACYDQNLGKAARQEGLQVWPG